MLRNLFTFAVLGIATSAGLLATGCATESDTHRQPYGLTGSSAENPGQNPRYYDSKGHFRPEWVNDGSH